MQIRKDFLELLKESSDFVDRHSVWTDVKKKLENDPRFKAVESGREREDYFLDFVHDLKDEYRREKDKKKNRRSSRSRSRSRSKGRSRRSRSRDRKSRYFKTLPRNFHPISECSCVCPFLNCCNCFWRGWYLHELAYSKCWQFQFWSYGT